MPLGENLVTDMLNLLKADWLDEEHKDVCKNILISAIDNMKDYVEEMEAHK